MSEKKENNKPSYKAKDIYVLEGLDPVRKRPGMYIGSTGADGVHHLVWEVVDNAIDEAMAGYAKNITVSILPENKVSVSDDGRGIPVDIHPQTKKSALETVMCTLHAGGKFGGESYKVSGGLHGVGVSVVNALSVWTKAEVCREGKKYIQEYKRGKPLYKVKKEGSCFASGTTVTFQPDEEIFGKPVPSLNWNKILNRLRQQAYLTKGVKITAKDSRGNREISHSFYFEGGLVSYLKFLSSGTDLIHENNFYASKEQENIFVEVAAHYEDDIESKEEAFANNIHTPDGGMHLTGFRTALTRTLNSYARKNGLLKESDDNLNSDDVKEGLVAIISVKLREPQFEGQTKAKLGNPEVRSAVEAVVNEKLAEYLEQNPQDARKIIEKCVISQKARKAAKAAKDTVLRKSALEGMTLPGKLADCSSKNPEESELYLVEGDSAGGCLGGDTKIALADGRDLSLEELIKEDSAGKRNYCYTIKRNGSISIGEIKNPRRTKKETKVIKIILDNNEEIVCTPDHKFMLKNGDYKKAESLKTSDSLMPLYRQYFKIGGRVTIDGYEMVFDPKENRWIFTHLLADKCNLKKNIYLKNSGDTVHHKDFNKLNNNPDNLIRISKEDHLSLYGRFIEKTLHRKDVKEKVKKIHQSKEYRSKISKIMLASAMKKMLSERAKKQWTSEIRIKRKKSYNQTYLRKALDVMRNIYVENKLIDKEAYDRIRKLKNDRSVIKYETIRDRFFEGNEEKLKEAVLNYNHRIKEIIPLKEKIDVYDIEVPKTHNFALASGVFVHNSAKQGRNRHFQAILPLKGKILNVEKARIDKMLAFAEIRSLIIALGTAIADEFNIEKLRYHRIIIMTDADVDGSHIRTLILTLFFRYFPALIERGYIYIAQPPLYSIKAGKKIEYAYSDSEKESILKKIKPENAKNVSDETQEGEEQGKLKGINIQRYKGLGEMNPGQLWETTMNPENRVLKRVAIEDAAAADKVFDVLMGSEVLPRKKFIQTHAKETKNLDI